MFFWSLLPFFLSSAVVDLITKLLSLSRLFLAVSMYYSSYCFSSSSESSFMGGKFDLNDFVLETERFLGTIKSSIVSSTHSKLSFCSFPSYSFILLHIFTSSAYLFSKSVTMGLGFDVLAIFYFLFWVMGEC